MYVISQILVVISYAFLAFTYLLKERKIILVFSLLSVAINGIAFILLSAWSGFYMLFVAILRNIIFLFRGKNSNDKKDYVDWIILICLVVIMLSLAIYSYDGIWSMLSVLGTGIYTLSVWQKNPTVYKVLGIPTSLCWIGYNVFVNSIFGIMLESILLLFALYGFVVAKDKKHLMKDDKE